MCLCSESVSQEQELSHDNLCKDVWLASPQTHQIARVLSAQLWWLLRDTFDRMCSGENKEGEQPSFTAAVHTSGLPGHVLFFLQFVSQSLKQGYLLREK